MEELGTHSTYRKSGSGNSPPTVLCAQFLSRSPLTIAISTRLSFRTKYRSQACQARSLARERHELNQTIGNIVSCSVHVAFVESLLNKLTDNELVLFYAHRSFPPSNRVLVGAA